jgi:Phage capsid family
VRQRGPKRPVPRFGGSKPRFGRGLVPSLLRPAGTRLLDLVECEGLHPDDYASFVGLTDTAGSIALPSLSSEAPSLLGRPVAVDAAMPAPAANAKSIVFGDIERAYVVRRTSGVAVQRLEELHSDSGQLGFRGAARVDGRVVLSDAARALTHSAS